MNNVGAAIMPGNARAGEAGARFDSHLLTFADAVGNEGPVAVQGGRSRWHIGGELKPDTRLVRAPTGIIAYQPEEMIVQVRAGTTVAELAHELARRGQRCALPMRTGPQGSGTVGGAIAVGENDLCSPNVGTVRSSVLQIRYVSAEGQLITGGGPTVKNVTGFDLPRLMVGALGTLGLIGEVTLRTNPLPAVSRWVIGECQNPRAVAAALPIPATVLWDGVQVMVLLEGHAPDVAAALEEIRRFGRFEETEPIENLPPHRWSLRPSDLASLNPADMGLFVASIGTGLVLAEQPQPTRELAAANRLIADRMKRFFDPTYRLNPGRDPAGPRT